MRVTRAIWLLSLTGIAASCVSREAVHDSPMILFKYHNPSGKTAVFNLNAQTITVDSMIIQFSDCGTPTHVCLRSPSAEIITPRNCNAQNSHLDYISNSDSLKLIGLDGLSGNIFKVSSPADKFAYGYHLRNGVVQLIIIPDSVDKTITEDRPFIPEYTYSISRSRGPFACAR